MSAYLHSATMVKAGVVLMAVASPILGKVDAWTNVGVAFGAVSMLWGAIGALRHLDAKLILAWGTVSQLGLMVTLLSLGVAKASFAAVSILFAHALFKAALFMIVGEIDVRAGTRNVSELSGLASSMPVAFVGALAAGLSMAGVPPLLGFAAKEAAIEAVIGLDGTQRWVVGAIVVGGSVLTVAYTARFLVLVFGGGGAPTTIGPPRWAMAVPASLLSFAGLAGFVVMGIANDIVRPAAVEVDAKADVYQLLRWPGLTTGLAISLGIVAVGALAGLAVARRPSTVPQSLGADTIDRSLDGVIVLARHVTGRVQHGSLPVYVLTMAATASLATVPFFWSIDTDRLFWWDRPAQAIVAVAIVTVAAATVFVRSRLGAALVLGAVGIGISGLFVLQGAPDLVLTQLLVETVVVVGFVIGLGHLRVEFPVNSTLWRSVRVAVSLMVGAGVAAGLASAASNPSGSPVTADLTEESVAVGGGNNVVNVILTDVRGLDTVGEVLVLAVVAVGIITLARAERADRSAAASQSEPGAVR